ncbi:hypothetical protein JYU09_00015 [bacterium AH-315-O15]|nr:hypothetical protein [bacterium AH-315-O15]
MTLARVCASAICVGSLLAVVPAAAHHGAAAAYDLNQYITLQGLVTEVKWENPHTWIYLEVTDESGTVVKWGFECAPPNQLSRRGFTPAILKPGLQITISGHPSRDTSRHFGEVHEVVLQDGRSFVIGGGDARAAARARRAATDPEKP